MKRSVLVVLVLVAVLVLAIVVSRSVRHRSEDDLAAAPAQPSVVVVVDPAHGGRDPGANAGGTLEKDVVLAIANRVSALSVEYPDLKVVLTRTSDVEVVSDERIAVATREGAVLYLALHANAFDKPSVNGVETWVNSSRTSSDPSWTLARSVQKAVVAASGARDRGVRSQDLFLRRLAIPAASAEVGFLTSPDERAKLLDPAYQDQVARGILQGVADYVAGTTTQEVAGTPQPSSAVQPASGTGTSSRKPGSGS